MSCLGYTAVFHPSSPAVGILKPAQDMNPSVLSELLQLNNAVLAHAGSDRAGSATFGHARLGTWFRGAPDSVGLVVRQMISEAFPTFVIP